MSKPGCAPLAKAVRMAQAPVCSTRHWASSILSMHIRPESVITSEPDTLDATVQYLDEVHLELISADL